MRSQADKFNVRQHKGAVVPAKRMTRDEAMYVAALRNSQRSHYAPGQFGSGEHVVRKDGPLNAPFWIVKELRSEEEQEAARRAYQGR